MPVFSIDYRKAPKHPYPDSSNDCYQGYYWIMTQAKKHLGMDIKKVIVAGDSAGGHLALNVITLAIIRQFRVPDGCVLLYPNVNSNHNMFSPSALLALDDSFLGINAMYYVR